MTGSAGNLAAVLEAWAAERGWDERVAFVAGEERTFTYREVHDGAARGASLLADAGAGPGDRVLVALDDGIEFVWAFLAAVRLGAVAVPVNPRLTPDDHRWLTADCGAAVAVCSVDLAERLAGRTRVVTAEGLEDALGAHPPLPAAGVTGDTPAYAQYTSGTTGAPKAALHRHGDPLVYFRAFATPALALGPADVVHSVSKLYFAYGLGNSLFFPLLSGARALLRATPPRAEEVTAAVARHRVTVLFAVPTLYAHLVASAAPGAFISLRAAVSAGEPLVPALAERVRNVLGCPVLDGLGSTEVGQTFASNTLDCWRDGTVGRPLPPYEVTVRDSADRDLPAGEIGTLWVRGPTVMLEYLGRPEATARVRRGAWLCTGDRASLDAEGFLRLHGRADDIEIVAGICLTPQEVEEVLARHPALTEVAVAGVRHPSGASRLEAFAVLSPGAVPDVVAAELVAMTRARLAPYKVPRAVHFVDALPRTPTGKLRRFVLRAGGDASAVLEHGA